MPGIMHAGRSTHWHSLFTKCSTDTCQRLDSENFLNAKPPDSCPGNCPGDMPGRPGNMPGQWPGNMPGMAPGNLNMQKWPGNKPKAGLDGA
eukprot:2232570-Rhodomonas_salina.3